MKGLLGLYLVSLAIAITSLSLSFDSLLKPSWISTRPFDSINDSPINVHLTNTYGLFETCTITSYSSTSNRRNKGGLKSKKECRKFPIRGKDCGTTSTTLYQHDTSRDESFCDRWLLAGYSHQLSLIFSLTSILSLILTLLGTLRAGRGYRTERLRSGWKLVVGLISLQSIFLAIGFSLITWEYQNESLFNLNWGHKQLGKGYVESVTAFGLLLVTVVAILFVRVTQKLRIVPQGAARDDGYDPID